MRASAVSLLGLLALPVLSQDITPSQSLAMAIANISDLSSFSNLMVQYPELLSVILPANETGNVTVLIPNNAAFARADSALNGSFAGLGMDKLVSIFKYHVVVTKLTSANFSDPNTSKGITVPTLLKDEAFNNRSAGADLTALYGADATGQVLFMSRDPISDRVLRIRQSLGGGDGGAGGGGGGGGGGASVNLNLRSGLAATTNLTAIDGTFLRGSFQVVDAVLTPPEDCSNTVRNSGALSSSLTGLDTALIKAGIWEVLDHSKNVTCLAPTTAAFAAADNPESKLNASDLADALFFHTLPQVTYSNFMVDGTIIKSLSGALVKITLKNNDIFFNDAKVVAANVLTNNGLIHVLDKVMSPLDENNNTVTEGSGSGDKNAAGAVRANGAVLTLAAAVGASLLLL